MPAASTRSGRKLWPLVLAAVVVIVVVLAAWGMQSRYAGGTGSSGDAAAARYTISVQKDGATLKQYDLSALRALPQSKVVIGGKVQSGPSLAALLEDAGAARYDSVVVRGAGIRDRGSLTLSAGQVSQKVQLDFSDRGTVKVCGPDLYHAEWVRDVITIDAR